MLPVYQAIEFKGVMEGGSTRPWQVTVLENGVPAGYVVKLYSEANNEQNYTVFKECVCSCLANEFDLQTPDPALIEFTPEFIQSLPVIYRQDLVQKDARIKFATKLVEPPYQNYSPALREEFLRSYDLGTIYAFDNLILNVDRRVDKPNMFFKDGEIQLIDHELTLVTAKNAEKALIGNDLWSHNYQRHIFYQELKGMDVSERIGCFDTFSYYLRELINLDFLDTIVDQLSEYDHPVDAYVDIKGYLDAAQQNANKFAGLIETTLE